MTDAEHSGAVKVFDIGSDGELKPARGNSSGSAKWVASDRVAAADIRALCATHGVELAATIQYSIDNPLPRPEVSRLGDLLFVSYKPTAEPAGSRATIVCTPETILSFHPVREALESVLDAIESGWRLSTPSTFGMLLELVDATSQFVSGKVFALRREVAILASEIESGTRGLASTDLLRLKADAAALESRYEDYLYCLAEFAKFEADADDGAHRSVLQQHQGDIDRGLAAVARVKARITDLHQYQVREADDTTNRRLKILTILSAIYLPATLIAGIYGMNFDGIPMTQVSWGYLLVLVAMGVVVVGQLILFYRRGWFR